MSNDDLVLLYALGLTDEEVDTTDEFINQVKICQLELVSLHIVAPLSKYKQKYLWTKINLSLKLRFFIRFKQIVKLWQIIVLTIFIGVFSTFRINAGVEILDARDTGWDVTMYQDKTLEIIAVSPMIVGKNKVCVMWIKNGKKITKIVNLPDYGNKTISLNEDLISKFNNGEIIISIEDRDNIVLPQKIEYRKKL